LLKRSPAIAAYWLKDGFYLEEFVLGERVKAKPLLTVVLDAFSRPRSLASARRELAPFGAKAVVRVIQQLVSRGFLVPANRKRPDVAAAWKDCFAAAYFHSAAKDVTYAAGPVEWQRVVDSRLAAAPQPPLFKEYKHAPFRRLERGDNCFPRASLGEILKRRRTVRQFRRSPVPMRVVSEVIRGTWGTTGRLNTGSFGKLLTKTSPSAGALHPVECYLLAWEVQGLAPGLYHYSVKRDGLERLRSGDLREQAVRAASGQTWVADASFLCILTVVVDRVFWKYTSPNAYRLFLLDAGHLAQTFCLLATASGLGAFTTAAIQDSLIEELLRIDGVREIPIYLCGAGFPDPSAAKLSVETLG